MIGAHHAFSSWCVMVGIVLCTVGCGGDDSSAYAELRKRQLQRELSNLTQATTPMETLERARESFKKTNYRETQETLRPLLIDESVDPQALILFAKCQAALGEKRDAADTLESISSSDAELKSEINWLAAMWLADAHLIDRAKAKLEAILSEQGDVNRVHRKLANLMNQEGRRSEAADHLRALARAGDITEKELFAMNCYGESFLDPDASLAHAPSDPSSNLARPGMLADARSLRSDSHLKQARQLIEGLAQQFPESTAISAFYGRVESDLGDDSAIRRWLGHLPAGIEAEPEYWHAVGMWMHRRGDHAVAIRCLAEAVARDPTDRFSMVLLARSLAVEGHVDAAQCVSEKFALLDEMDGIMRQIGQQAGSRDQLNRIAAILDDLERPWEATEWREVALRTHGGTEKEREALRNERTKLAASSPSARKLFGAPTKTSVCGIRLDDWPLPALDQLAATTTSTPPRSVDSDSIPNDGDVAAIPLDDVASRIGLQFQYDAGIDPTSEDRLLHQLTGGGIGVLDFDRDGRSDLYFTQGGGDAFDPTGSLSNALFRNADGIAVDVSTNASVGDRGYGQGVAVADLNQDGFADMVVANIGVNVIYINNGDGTFRLDEDLASDFESVWTSSIACGDLDGDHLPEVFEVNYIDDPRVLVTPCTRDSELCSPSRFLPAADRVYRVGNDGTLKLWDGCQSLAEQPCYGFAAVIANFDRVEGNDVFVANDALQNQYWMSRRDEDSQATVLTENAVIQGCGLGLLGQRHGCMGTATGDYDRSGTLDLLITNFWSQAADLYMQDANGFFTHSSAKWGIDDDTRETVGWGVQAVDFDRDGWLDVAMLNGHLVDQRHRGRPYQMLPQYFSGSSDGFRLADRGSNASSYWTIPSLGRTMAIVDWNGDQRPDLVVNHLDHPAAMLQNTTTHGNAIRFELVGTTSERDAIGAEIQVQCGEERWTAWQIGGDGLLCSNESVIDVGVGVSETIDKVTIRWPSGVIQTIDGLDVNHQYLIIEGEADAFSID